MEGSDMERWFTQRRKSKVLELADKQLALAVETVDELWRSIIAVSKNDTQDAKKHIGRLFQTEEEIDDIRRSIFDETTKGSLPVPDREDLMHLVQRVDTMADHAKDAGRNVLLLLEIKIPKEFWNAYADMAKSCVECVKVLKSSIERLGSDPAQARSLAQWVDQVEKKVDDKYLKIKARMLKSDKEVAPSAMIVLKDLLESLEQVADYCDDTADYVKVLALTREES
jgi:predicted phosphate transport protein (TIGR00153 family)